MPTTRDLVALGDAQLGLAQEQDDVRGMTVLDPRGHRVGDVDEILMDERDRRARLLVIASGGLLGLARHRRLVPVEAVDRVGSTVRLERSDLHVETGFDYEPDAGHRVDYPAVCAYFGYAPFWEADRTAPYFHRRR